MTPHSLSSVFTTIRTELAKIVGSDGVLAKLAITRSQLDLGLGVLKTFAESAMVSPGPAMPPPDSTAPDAPAADKPWSVGEHASGQNKNFRHPDDVSAIYASLQALQEVLGETVTYKKYDGTDGVTTPMAAFMKVQV